MDGVQKLGADLGKGFFSSAASAAPEILRSVGPQIHRGAEGIGKSFFQGAGPAAAEALKTIGEGGGEGFLKFGEGAAGGFEAIGGGLGKAFHRIGKAFAESFEETSHSMNATFLTRMLPTMGIGLVVWHGLPLMLHYIFQYFISIMGKPRLALKQRKTTFFTPFINLIRGKPKPSTRQAFFNKQVAEQIEQVAGSTKNIRENGAYFQNVLLYGPPGTGKTMIAELIAEKSDMDFVSMSAGSLSQYIGRKEHVAELNRLLESAQNGKKPTILFIDEAEGIGADREKLDPERIELLNTLLAATGSGSKKIMLILATNLPQKLDPALLDRMSQTIEIKTPEFEQRIAIIDQYVHELLGQSRNLNQFFNREAVEAIARKTDGLSGRSLFQMVNMIASEEAVSKNRELTQEKIDKIVDRFTSRGEKVKPALVEPNNKKTSPQPKWMPAF